MWDLFVRIVSYVPYILCGIYLKAKVVFVSSSRVAFPQSSIDWNAESQDRMETTGFCDYLTGKAFP